MFPTYSPYNLFAPSNRRILEDNPPGPLIRNKFTSGRVNWLLGNPQPIQPPRLPPNHAHPTMLQIQNTHKPPCLPTNLENPIPTRIPHRPNPYRLHPPGLQTHLRRLQRPRIIILRHRSPNFCAKVHHSLCESSSGGNEERARRRKQVGEICGVVGV